MSRGRSFAANRRHIQIISGVKANDEVSFQINSGEIHALLGENGAGKSTLVKMIYGLMQPDSGNMKLSLENFRPSEPSKARQSGIAMVFQHFSLFDALNVAENIALGMENPPKLQDLSEKIETVSKSYGFHWTLKDWLANYQLVSVNE